MEPQRGGCICRIYLPFIKRTGSMECPICRETFNREANIPLLLCCGHSVCTICCENIFYHSNVITCPLDRTTDIRRLDRLTKNLLVLELIEDLVKKNRTISFLRLSPDERASSLKAIVTENKDTALQAAEITVQACELIQDSRTQLLATIQSTFAALQRALEERKEKFERQLNAEAEEKVAECEKLRNKALLRHDQAVSYLAKVSSKSLVTQDEVNLKKITDHEDLPRFTLGFKWQSSSAIDFVSRVGNVGPWKVSVPYSCKHYSSLTYWRVPNCCRIPVCCKKCHDENQDHMIEKYFSMICMYCDHEMNFNNEQDHCDRCGKPHSHMYLR
mmetsp:Transcript_25606/g.44729  ORF Transcript_25606/g.44729 Transcript_25606/m.44729 type:complete len:331 (-) Transcript_25606:26-1018(-)